MFEIHEGIYNTVEDGINFYKFLDYETRTTNKKITYYNDIYAFDIETSSFKDFDEEELLTQDIEVYNHIKGVKIKITDKIFKEFPGFNITRRELFGRIYFSKVDGISIDSFYHELTSLFPYYFSEDIINPYDQLTRIIEVFNDNAPERIETDNKRALMYVWQIAINGRVIIGRTWDQFIKLLTDISTKLGLNDHKRIIIWVHSLKFEFQFMKDYFKWKKVFAINNRTPIYALTDIGIEFRCSYILSNLSLENVGKSLQKYKVQKLVGALNYDLIRHEKTPLEPQTINYIINDVLVVSAYIKERIEEVNGNITRLPLTATGYCRIFVRNNCLGVKDNRQFKHFRKIIDHLTIDTVEEYQQLTRAFMGGFTHCNAVHACKVLHDVDSFDFTSAYPYALISEKMPMSKSRLVHVKTVDEVLRYNKLYFTIFDVKFENLQPRFFNENYISFSKCNEIKNPIINNGRVVSASLLSTTISGIDFDIIRRVYTWDKIYFKDFRVYIKDYLPKEIILSILELYKNKTTLKDVPGQEDFYTKNKQLLNSIYGMMVTSVISPFFDYDDIEGWTETKRDIKTELDRYNKSKKRFLFFPWGIACTAYVRRNLWSGILAFNGDDKPNAASVNDYIYSDTDSLKVLHADKHKDYIERYNKLVEYKLKKVSEHYNIPFEMFAPKTVEGEVKMIGVWDCETAVNGMYKGPWKCFKSLGAKRYMILTQDDKLTLTVSGVNKKYAIPYILDHYGKENAFTIFNNDLVIPEEHTGKLTHFYLDNCYQGEVTDYLGNTIKYKCKSGIYLEKTSYHFSMELGYLNYLKELRGKIIA